MMELLKNVIKKVVPKVAFHEVSLSDAGCRIINGSFEVSQCAVSEPLKINGSARLGNNTIVKTSMIVNGQLEAVGARIEDELWVSGAADISSSALIRKSHFSGNLTARDCQFSDSLTLRLHHASFVNCQINSAIFNDLPYVKTAQKLRLSGGCVVNGDITFESGNGEVWIDKSSTIHGHVRGGKIIVI